MKGRSAGRLRYGYEVITTFDAAGEPARGERRIKEVEAEVVRRVFREFASGVIPRATARRLNDKGIPAPPEGAGPIPPSAVKASAEPVSSTNELYIGHLVWNRLHFVKKPASARRISQANRRDDWIVTEVPELRIVDQSLWQAAARADRRSTLAPSKPLGRRTPNA